MRTRRLIAACIACVAGVVALSPTVGCGGSKKQQKADVVPPRYPPQPRREVPAWLKNSIFEEVDLSAIEPFRVSNFGLVVLRQPTGDARNAPYAVREYMLREMTKRGFGNNNYAGFAGLTPEAILQSPYASIVRVDAFIPAGAPKGTRLDASVAALENSDTTSLAGGTLFTTELFKDGANPAAPGVAIDIMARARGYVFVNPAYALDGAAADPVKQRSLTAGTVLAGAETSRDRPLILNIRSAERRISRMTEKRIDQLFGDDDVANALDEGSVAVNVPAKYRGDWEHFAGVILHTFWVDNDGFAAQKAIQLVDEIQKPGAMLLDISYTWEALGRPAVSAIQPLYTHARKEIAFAAARAGAFIGDSAAEVALAAIARDPASAYRTNAVKVLAALPATPAINALLRDLAATAETSVRIEAYLALAHNKDAAIENWSIGGDKFRLDVLENSGPPIVYASRSGVPRIAFIGGGTRLPAPTFFSAMNDQLTISAVENRSDLLSIYFRRPGESKTIQMLTRPDLADLVSRLGGGPSNREPDGQPKFDFTYGEIVAIVTRLADQRQLMAAATAGEQTTGVRPTFVLQDPPAIARDLENAPIIPDGPRPISDAK